MQDILEICCGLDVHKETVVACLLKGSTKEVTSKEIRTFSTLLTSLNQLVTWLVTEGCYHVAMESTGVYWHPVYHALEDVFPTDSEIIVTNARHMKNVPGKKTDMKDAEWIATLLRAGLLQGSFIPSKDIRELRDFTRYRKSIVHEISSQKNRIEKHLQSCGFKLSTFLSDIFGMSGRAIIDIIAKDGYIDPQTVQFYIKGRAKSKTDNIRLAINGKMTMHQKGFLTLLLKKLDESYDHLTAIEHQIQAYLQSFDKVISKIDDIPGIDITAASAIVAEIGVDMSKFRTYEHICSWAGLSPGSNESAGKKKNSRMTDGNPYIKSVLCEVAWSITRIRSSYLSSWYWKIKQRRGAKRAIVALARKLLVIIYSILKNDTCYDENKFTQIRKNQEERRKKHIVQEAKKLGLHITEIPQTA